ncbi:basic salivary proline-rich protein 2-like, partial [Pezoporus occidentalis]|uniref:basic salivary proline-rich protein 2-like n=1 Tax=Pezoporus occidentalis TaxID=407982 RepID=UPI002F91509D
MGGEPGAPPQGPPQQPPLEASPSPPKELPPEEPPQEDVDGWDEDWGSLEDMELPRSPPPSSEKDAGPPPQPPPSQPPPSPAQGGGGGLGGGGGVGHRGCLGGSAQPQGAPPGPGPAAAPRGRGEAPGGAPAPPPQAGGAQTGLSAGIKHVRRERSRGCDPSVRLSKALSYVLRHGAAAEGLPMGPDGFVPLGALLRLPRFRGVSEREVRNVVAADPKGRFRLSPEPLRIRANQGHSLHVRGGRKGGTPKRGGPKGGGVRKEGSQKGG